MVEDCADITRIEKEVQKKCDKLYHPKCMNIRPILITASEVAPEVVSGDFVDKIITLESLLK